MKLFILNTGKTTMYINKEAIESITDTEDDSEGSIVNFKSGGALQFKEHKDVVAKSIFPHEYERLHDTMQKIDELN